MTTVSVIQRISDGEKITSLCALWGTTAAVWAWTPRRRNRGPSSQSGELGHKGPLKNGALSLMKLGNRGSEPSDTLVLLLLYARCIWTSQGPDGMRTLLGIKPWTVQWSKVQCKIYLYYTYIIYLPFDCKVTLFAHVQGWICVQPDLISSGTLTWWTWTWTWAFWEEVKETGLEFDVVGRRKPASMYHWLGRKGSSPTGKTCSYSEHNGNNK